MSAQTAPVCVVCHAPGPLNAARECRECEPREGEACADWIDRTRETRVKRMQEVTR